MKTARPVACAVLASMLVSTPAFAQQPIRESARRASGKFWTGLVVGAAGGTAVVLGTTALRTRDTTSGNTPPSAYDACVALTTNPVYRGNDCGVLKGPNIGLVVGGAAAIAAGTALMMLGRANNSVQFGPGRVRFQHRMTF